MKWPHRKAVNGVDLLVLISLKIAMKSLIAGQPVTVTKIVTLAKRPKDAYGAVKVQ